MRTKIIQLILAVIVIGLSIGLIVTSTRLKNFRKTGSEIICGEFGTVIDELEGKCKANFTAEDCITDCTNGAAYCGNHQVYDEGTNKCKLQSDVCGINQEFNGDKCVTLPSVCGNGTTLQANGKCSDCQTPNSDLNEVCGNGTTLQDGKCVPDASTCGTDTTFQNGKCVPDASVCGTGTTFQNGKCVANTPTSVSQCANTCCGEGTTFFTDQQKCVANTIIPCEAGYERPEGSTTCVQIPTERECPDGYFRPANSTECEEIVTSNPQANEEDEKSDPKWLQPLAIVLAIVVVALLMALFLRKRTPIGPSSSETDNAAKAIAGGFVTGLQNVGTGLQNVGTTIVGGLESTTAGFRDGLGKLKRKATQRPRTSQNTSARSSTAVSARSI